MPAADAYSHCEEMVRTHDPDRYWASLFAPADKRPHLHALYAFSLEIARVREAISAPLAGELRLQWWRDTLNGTQAYGEAASHPVAGVLMEAIAQFGLPGQAFQDLIDARVFDLYDDPMPSLADLEGYCGETSSALFRLASLVLMEGAEPGGAEAAGHAGAAFAVTGLLRALPWHLSRGQVYLPADILAQEGLSREALLAGGPVTVDALRRVAARMRQIVRDHLQQARQGLAVVAPQARAAFLPLATVPAYLMQMERRDYDPARSLIEVAQWRRLWTLWRTARAG